MKFYTFFTKNSDSRANSSDFSRFFREASSREKKRVYIEVAKKASQDQMKVVQEYRKMVTQ